MRLSLVINSVTDSPLAALFIHAFNAAHHAPARKIEVDDILRVAGRVHALVRRLAAGIRSPPS